ncbi:MAG TPA: hypothetical protein VIY29_09740, partial [Ktedonobacteraceae bacterium]
IHSLGSVFELGANESLDTSPAIRLTRQVESGGITPELQCHFPPAFHASLRPGITLMGPPLYVLTVPNLPNVA